MLSRYSIKKPVTVIVIILLIAIFGIVSAGNMSVELIPDIDVPYFVVTTVSPGQSSHSVEKSVTSVLEESLSTVDNVKSTQSISADNYSVIIMEMTQDSDLNSANLDISTKLKEIYPELPENTFEPILTQISADMLPVFSAALSLENSDISLSSDYLNSITEELKTVNGVASADTVGLVDNLVLIALKSELIGQNLNLKLNGLSDIIDGFPSSGTLTFEEYEKLASYDPAIEQVLSIVFTKTDSGYVMSSVGSSAIVFVNDVIEGVLKSSDLIEQLIEERGDITADNIKNLVIGQNINLPAGTIESNGYSLLVNVKDELTNLSDLYNLPILNLKVNQMTESLKIYWKESPDDGDTSGGADDPFFINGNAKTISSSAYLSVMEGDEYNTNQKLFVSLMYLEQSNGMYKVNDGMYALLTGNGLDGFDIDAIDFSFTFKLTDLTEVTRLTNAGTVNSVINGSDGVIVDLYKQPDASAVSVSNGLKEKLKEIQNDNPSFVYIVLSDQGDTIQSMIFTLILNIVLGAVLAVIVLFIFLRKFRPTLIVGATIFISILISVIILYLCGVSLNLVSLGGLVVAVGMLVDNSIVVYENIYRKRLEGVPAVKAAADGAGQVSKAVICSTITTIVVFLPIIFLSGYTRQLLMDFALSVTISLIASLLISLTFIPMTMARVSDILPKKSKSLKPSKLQAGYEKALSFVMVKKWVVLVPVLVLFVATAIGSVFVNQEFFPDSSTEYLTVSSVVDTSKADDNYYLTLKKYIDEVDSVLENFDFVVDRGISVSTVSTVNLSSRINDLSSIGTTNVEMKIVLKKGSKSKNNKNAQTITDTIKTIEEKYGGLFNVQQAVAETNISFGLTASEVNVEVKADDNNYIREISALLSERFYEVKGVTSVSNALSFTNSSYNIEVDSLKATEYSLTAGEIYLAIYNALNTSSVTSNMELTDGENQNTFILSFSDYSTILNKWYYATDSKGNVCKIYTENYYDIYGETNTVYFIKDDNGFKTYLEKTDSGFSSLNENYISDSDIVFYEYLSPVSDLITFEIQATDRITGQSISVPLYKLLKESSFEKDSSGNILMREDGVTPLRLAVVENNNSIIHTNKETSNTLIITLDKSESKMFAVSDIKNIVKEISELYPDTQIVYTGENEIIQSVYQSLYFIFALAIILVYLVMAATFQSFKGPLVIMITMLLAFTGAMLGLFVTLNNFSVFAFIGIIVLMGVVVNNGIVFVDYINQMRKEGMDKKEAIIKAARDRVRPILMTSLTTVIALLSSAFDYSATGDNMRPLAITSIFGLLYATVLTLFVVPALYDLIYDFKIKKKIKNKKSEKNSKGEIADVEMSGGIKKSESTSSNEINGGNDIKTANSATDRLQNGNLEPVVCKAYDSQSGSVIPDNADIYNSDNSAKNKNESNVIKKDSISEENKS